MELTGTTSINTTTSPRDWDVFCTVVDNFGDIGICWRFARQLVNEHKQQVRLWVDDLHSFKKLCPAIEPLQDKQYQQGVEIRRWNTPFASIDAQDIANVVVEAFACRLPDSVRQAMCDRHPKPLWINMEYLSAEDWVAGCHGLSSLQAQHGLQKVFFFPGFVQGTGGLLQEKNVLKDRDVFQASTQAQAEFWQALGLLPKQANEYRFSVFAYDNNAFARLVDVWAASPVPVLCLLPEGKLASRFFAEKKVDADTCQQKVYQQANVTVKQLPFLEQDAYDRLLWACDVNFVRGEDSFVRAQWAGKPFVWQIYPQEEQAHLVKLRAFLQLYSESLPASASIALHDFWLAWNEGKDIGETWEAFFAGFAMADIFTTQQENWLAKMEKVGDFSSNMMIYCQKYL